MAAIRSLPTRINALVLSPAARPLRFAGAGGAAGAVQLVLLAILTRHGWDALLANATAFLLAAQVNFALSVTVTWRDRHPEGRPSAAARGRRMRPLVRRWLLFHGSIALMALVNMLTFELTRSFLPTALASLAGIAAGAIGNYLAGDRLVFRDRSGGSSTYAERSSAA